MILQGCWAKRTESDVDMRIHRTSSFSAAWLTSLVLLAGVSVLPDEVAEAQVNDPAAFTVRDMRVEGLQRISEGTVFNYLPINIGDNIDSVRIREAISALYGQGLFIICQLPPG